MELAVVGDLHGHLALMYAILGRWQGETGRHIDLILQCGDMGAFPRTSHLDQATTRWAKNDPEELGFAEFVEAAPPPTLLDPRPPLVFIPGNHEDFEFLAECERTSESDESVYPVSEDQKIRGLKSGCLWSFCHEGESVRVAGVSGVAGRSHKKGRHPRYYFSDEEALQLAELGRGEIDIMISHDAPSGLVEDYRGMEGSPALRLVIEETAPSLAFFAHYDRVGQWRIGATEVFGMGKCGYVPSGHWPVGRGGITIVSWNDGKAGVERLQPDWLDQTTRDNWRHWGRAR